MKSGHSPKKYPNQRLKYIVLTLLSGLCTAWLLYLLQPDKSSGAWVMTIIFGLVFIIPITTTLLIASLSKNPSAMFKTIIKALGEIFGPLFP